MSKKTHFESIEAAKAYVEEHAELKELIHTLIRMCEHPKAMCKIQIGTYNPKDKSFSAKLTSNVRFANTLFSFYEREMQVYIKNHTENICLFNVAAIGKILYQHSYSVPKPLNYTKEIYVFLYRGDNYRLEITFESN